MRGAAIPEARRAETPAAIDALVEGPARQTTGRHKDIAKLVELEELARLRAESETGRAP